LLHEIFVAFEAARSTRRTFGRKLIGVARVSTETSLTAFLLHFDANNRAWCTATHNIYQGNDDDADEPKAFGEGSSNWTAIWTSKARTFVICI
jgi:hypothetical protein